MKIRRRMEIELRQSRVRQFAPSEQNGFCPTCGGTVGPVNAAQDTGTMALMVDASRMNLLSAIGVERSETELEVNYRRKKN